MYKDLDCFKEKHESFKSFILCFILKRKDIP